MGLDWASTHQWGAFLAKGTFPAKAWFKKGSGTVAGTAGHRPKVGRVLRTTVPDPFLNHATAKSVCLIQVAVTRRTSGVRSNIMPKQKTHKGTKKRFRLTAKGKAKHRQSGTSHLAARMSHKRKRNLRGTAVVDDTDGKKIVEALCGNSY